jgi:plastocyanin
VNIPYPKLCLALLVVAVAAAGGVTATIAHGNDPPATAKFHTVDFADVFQLEQGSGSSTSANIATGGTVTFANSSTEMHNVDFDIAGQTGVSCEQTAGGTASSSLRFPNTPTDGTWSGVCTFARPGTYSFMCDMHEGMTGTVVVGGSTAPPGTTTTASTTTATPPVETIPAGGTTTTPPPDPRSDPSSASTPAANTAGKPVAAARALSVRVGLTQRGSGVRGTISGARSSARVKVALSARRGAIGLAGKAATPVGIGELSALTTKNGTLAFVVKLNGKARAALAKHGRLALTVLVSAPPVTGAATPKAFRVVLRPVGG